MESLRNRFKKISAERRDKNAKNQATSGIVKERGKREILLDNLILAMDEQEERSGRNASRRRRKRGG